MMNVIFVTIYMLIGVLGRKVFGYAGIIETIFWPLAILGTLFLKSLEEDE